MLRDSRDVVETQITPGADVPYGSGLSDLERAVLATVTYRDLFDYPVSAAEIHRYLQGIRCSPEEVHEVLAGPGLAGEYVSGDGSLFALQGREHLFGLRKDREAIAAVMWPRALLYASRLAALPFVRMVAVTGSLAVNNPGDDADIDFMLVTNGGRVWSTRLLAKVLQLCNDVFGAGEMCVNHVISMRALALDDHGLYIAQELVQMVPVFGLSTYQQLRDANPWTFDILPNAIGAPPRERTQVVPSAVRRRIGEAMLRTPLGRQIENWECRRKLRKYNETEFLLGRATEFREEATGHRRTVKEAIETALADRLQGPRSRRSGLRILFGQAYHLKFDSKLWRSMQPFPPLGCLYAAAVARSLGHNARVHDSMLSVSLGEWAAAMQINDPDVVVLFEDNFNYLTKMCLLSMRDAAKDMIRIAKDRGALVVVCSSDSADEPRLYLDAGADFVMLGEGEETFADLLHFIDGTGSADASSVPGLAFMDTGGSLVRTASRAVIRQIDNLPLPAWDLVDLRRYREIWTRRHGRFSLNMVTTRGCPYHCNWCAKPVWGQRYNARSVESVIEEILWLRELADFDFLWFMDDIFGLKPHWIARFADTLQAADVRIRFKCLSRPDLLLRDGETAALARAGCDIVWMGAESGSQKILDAMEKGTTVDMIDAACAALRRHDIRVGLFIQFGYPGETRADIRATIDLVRRIMPDELGISVSYPLPGTRFYDRVQAELGVTRHWQDSDDLRMLFKGPFNTGFYRALHRYVHSDMAARRFWRDRKAVHLGYAVIRRIWFATAMAVLARMPHRGLTALPGEMHQGQAAIPSAQPED